VVKPGLPCLATRLAWHPQVAIFIDVLLSRKIKARKNLQIIMKNKFAAQFIRRKS
jgi:hypothetical protein